jgi:hypothetical protein
LNFLCYLLRYSIQNSKFKSLFETTEDKYVIVTMLISKLRKNGYRFFTMVSESNKINVDDGNKAITSFIRDK